MVKARVPRGPSLVVTRRPGAPMRGILRFGALALPCAIGRAGVTRLKREGDGATPAGCYALLHGFARTDRIGRPATRAPLRAIAPHWGWSDDAGSPRYNRLVTLPVRESAERLWRDDRLYDVVIVLDYNIAPRRRGRGSAIFFHVAHDALTPTEGCVALRLADMRRLLPRLTRATCMIIR